MRSNHWIGENDYLPGIESALEILEPAIGSDADRVLRVMIESVQRVLDRALQFHGRNNRTPDGYRARVRYSGQQRLKARWSKRAFSL